MRFYPIFHTVTNNNKKNILLSVIDALAVVSIVLLSTQSCSGQIDINRNKCSRKTTDKSLSQTLPPGICIPLNYTIEEVITNLDFDRDKKSDVVLRYSEYPLKTGATRFYAIYKRTGDTTTLSSYTSSRHSECKICGEWRWEKNDEQHDFSVQISMQDGFLLGKHCYILDYGNKIDCSSEREDESFKVSYRGIDSVQMNIRSYYSGLLGVAEIKMKNGKLHWKLINAPKGEYYLPKEALLIKDKVNK